MALVDLLTMRATLQKGTTVASNTGDRVTTWATVRTNVPCMVRLQPFLADLKPGTSRIATHTILTPILSEVLADPKGDWQFIVGGRPYLIVEPRNPANRTHHMETHARRLD